MKFYIALLLSIVNFYLFADDFKIYNDTSVDIKLYVSSNKCYDYNTQNFVVPANSLYVWYDHSRANCDRLNENLWLQFNIFKKNASNEWASVGGLKSVLDADHMHVSDFSMECDNSVPWESPYQNGQTGWGNNEYYSETAEDWCIDKSSGLMGGVSNYPSSFLPSANFDDTPEYIVHISGF